MQAPYSSSNDDYAGMRALVPPYGRFGAATHMDNAGREYRVAPLDPPRLGGGGDDGGDGPDGTQESLIWWSRLPIRQRTPAERRSGTPIGGGSNRRPAHSASLAGGPWHPKWPQPGDELTLLRVADQVLECGVVRALWSRPRSSTARVEFAEPLEPAAPPSATAQAVLSFATTAVAGPSAGGNGPAGPLPLSNPGPFARWTLLSPFGGGGPSAGVDDDEGDDIDADGD